MRTVYLYFTIRSAEYELCFPEMARCSSLSHLQRLFRAFFLKSYDSEDAVSLMGEAFPVWVAECKEYWHETQKAYYDGYKDPSMLCRDVTGKQKSVYTPKERKAIRAKNARLLSSVKSAKRAYDMAVKKHELFCTMREELTEKR